jgi:hypothetical protein
VTGAYDEQVTGDVQSRYKCAFVIRIYGGNRVSTGSIEEMRELPRRLSRSELRSRRRELDHNQHHSGSDCRETLTNAA